MNWLSFVLGALAGWIVEWLIDIFYWRRRWQTCRDEEAELRRELVAANGELARMRSAGMEIEGLRGELRTANAESARWRAGGVEIEGLRAELAARELQLDALRGETARLSALQGDLDLAHARVAELDARLSVAQIESPTFEAHVVNAGEAAVTGERDELLGTDVGIERGVFAPTAAATPDDLQILEGIGPAISRVLNEQGIHTFAELAGTPLATLERILTEAGPRFRVADPASWAAQALLAAQADWDGLQALQSQLKGGRAAK